MVYIFTNAVLYASMLWGSVWGGSGQGGSAGDCGYTFVGGAMIPNPCDDGGYYPES